MEQAREVVVITGSGGRIGSALAERLAERYTLVGFDRRPNHCAPTADDCLQVDVTDDESVSNAFAHVREAHGSRIRAFYHLAAYYSFAEADHPQYDRVNVDGTARLLRGLREFEVGQFIFSSTMIVHPPCQPGERLDENSPLDRETDWGYARSKIAAEERIRAEHGDIPVVLLRLASAYDEMCRHPALARHLQRIYEKDFTGQFFPGNPHHGMTYIHYADLIDALARVLDRPELLEPEQALLLGEQEPVSYQELQQELGQLIHGEDWATRTIPATVAKVGAWVQDRLSSEEAFVKPWMIEHADDHYALDTTRARTLLGWENRHTLREMLPAMVAVLKQDPRAWYEANGLEPPSEQATA